MKFESFLLLQHFLAHLRWVIVSAFCLVSILHRPASVNIFTSVTNGSIGMKLLREQNSFKFLGSMQNSGFHVNQMKRTFSFPKLVCWFSNCFVEMVLGWPTLYRIPSSHVDWSKSMAFRGRGLFVLYSYSENLLLRKYQADFQIIL